MATHFFAAKQVSEKPSMTRSIVLGGLQRLFYSILPSYIVDRATLALCGCPTRDPCMFFRLCLFLALGWCFFLFGTSNVFFLQLIARSKLSSGGVTSTRWFEFFHATTPSLAGLERLPSFFSNFSSHGDVSLVIPPHTVNRSPRVKWLTAFTFSTLSSD